MLSQQGQGRMLDAVSLCTSGGCQASVTSDGRLAVEGTSCGVNCSACQVQTAPPYCNRDCSQSCVPSITLVGTPSLRRSRHQFSSFGGQCASIGLQEHTSFADGTEAAPVSTSMHIFKPKQRASGTDGAALLSLPHSRKSDSTPPASLTAAASRLSDFLPVPAPALPAFAKWSSFGPSGPIGPTDNDDDDDDGDGGSGSLRPQQGIQRPLSSPEPKSMQRESLSVAAGPTPAKSSVLSSSSSSSLEAELEAEMLMWLAPGGNARLPLEWELLPPPPPRSDVGGPTGWPHRGLGSAASEDGYRSGVLDNKESEFLDEGNPWPGALFPGRPSSAPLCSLSSSGVAAASTAYTATAASTAPAAYHWGNGPAPILSYARLATYLSTSTVLPTGTAAAAPSTCAAAWDLPQASLCGLPTIRSPSATSLTDQRLRPQSAPPQQPSGLEQRGQQQRGRLGDPSGWPGEASPGSGRPWQGRKAGDKGMLPALRLRAVQYGMYDGDDGGAVCGIAWRKARGLTGYAVGQTRSSSEALQLTGDGSRGNGGRSGSGHGYARDLPSVGLLLSPPRSVATLLVARSPRLLDGGTATTAADGISTGTVRDEEGQEDNGAWDSQDALDTALQPSALKAFARALASCPVEGLGGGGAGDGVEGAAAPAHGPGRAPDRSWPPGDRGCKPASRFTSVWGYIVRTWVRRVRARRGYRGARASPA